MRVLIVTHAFPRSRGDVAGSFVLRLARALMDSGVTVLVLAPSGPGLAAAEVLDGVAVRRFRYAPRHRETLAYTGTMAEQVGATLAGKLAILGLLGAGAMAVRRTAAVFRPDVVHAHWWFPAGLMSLGALMHRPLVTTMHGSDVRLARTSRGGPALFRRVMRRSSAVTAVSGWLAAEAKALLPGLEVAVAPMPVDVDLFAPPRGAAHEWTRATDRLLFVGRLNAQKGIALLLEALAASTRGATLDVVGTGDDRAVLEQRAASLGLAARVRWHGVLRPEELVPLYRQATGVVVPSENEGLGLVAVEALLCETPVIATRSGGLTDVVEDGVTGLLVPPADVSALAAAIDALLGRPDRGASLGRAGRIATLARFSPPRVAQVYRAIYAKVAAR